MPPTTVIENDAGGNVETGGVFDPATDGIDFYESLEAMLLRVNNPVVVGHATGSAKSGRWLTTAPARRFARTAAAS